MPTALEIVRGRIAERGPLPFSEVVDVALYHPTAGFYATGGRAGRRGDFLTSPEVGPLFGAVVARALDAWWHDLGRPDRFAVIEVGAGPGALARTIQAASPVCSVALRYVLVEASEAQRTLHADVVARSGGKATSTHTLPAPDGPAIVLANELLDNLPFDLLERTADGWRSVLVDVADDGNGALVEVLGVVHGDLPPGLDDAPIGARIPLQDAAADWLRDARALAGPGGRVVAIDYASSTADLARREATDWLRTYRRHERGSGPLDDLGEQDVTCEVCVDQLALVAEPTHDAPQADWLRAHGIGVLVDEGKRIWTERAHLGDLEAVKARSRVTEAEALLDPEGLGAFRVLEWMGTSA